MIGHSHRALSLLDSLAERGTRVIADGRANLETCLHGL